jgi:hypothetical protein
MNDVKQTRSQTIARACGLAMQIQDACNVTAVLGEWHQQACMLRRYADLGGDDLRQHPAMIAFADKVQDLLGRPTWDETLKAFDACVDQLCEHGVEPLTPMPGQIKAAKGGA